MHVLIRWTKVRYVGVSAQKQAGAIIIMQIRGTADGVLGVPIQWTRTTTAHPQTVTLTRERGRHPASTATAAREVSSQGAQRECTAKVASPSRATLWRQASSVRRWLRPQQQQRADTIRSPSVFRSMGSPLWRARRRSRARPGMRAREVFGRNAGRSTSSPVRCKLCVRR